MMVFSMGKITNKTGDFMGFQPPMTMEEWDVQGRMGRDSEDLA